MIEKYANQLGWTDCEPHEIVKEVSKITLEVKAMHSEKDESVKMDFQVGWLQRPTALTTTPNNGSSPH